MTILTFCFFCNIYYPTDSTDTHWLNTISATGKVNVTSLYAAMHKPINSIDIDRSMLLFGCDNEAMYIVRNVLV